MKYLNDQEKGKLFAAILDFAEMGVMPNLEEESPVMQLAFDAIKPHIERDHAAYLEKSLKAVFAVWKRDHEVQAATTDFDRWIMNNREKYSTEILQVPAILEQITIREESLPPENRVFIATENGSFDINRYRTISNDIQPQPQRIPNTKASSVPNASSSSTPTADAEETTSTGENFDQVRNAKLAQLRGMKK